MLQEYPDLLIAAQVCEILHISRNTLYALLRSKQIHAFQQNRIWKIPKQAVVNYIVQHSGLN